MGHRYSKSGNVWSPFDRDAADIRDQLAAGCYIIGFNPQAGGFFLERVDSFEMPSKIYGDVHPKAARIMSTFDSRPATTGVLLSGEKGSGKTLLTKMLSVQGALLGMPTIIINRDWIGDSFNKFIQDIDQPCIMLFDEFEKVYAREKQEAILTLLDGVFPSKKLFLFTCNDKYRIDHHMTNRPGRIFYHLEYEGLDCEFIKEYCLDNLNEPKWADTICNISATFDQFNFDILKAIIEEMNRYNESPIDALKMLNATPAKDRGGRYHIELTLDGKKYKSAGLGYINNSTIAGNPIALNEINVQYYKNEEALNADENDEIDCDYGNINFPQMSLSAVDPASGRFIYTVGKAVLTFTRMHEEKFSYSNIAAMYAL